MSWNKSSTSLSSEENYDLFSSKLKSANNSRSNRNYPRTSSPVPESTEWTEDRLGNQEQREKLQQDSRWSDEDRGTRKRSVTSQSSSEDDSGIQKRPRRKRKRRTSKRSRSRGKSRDKSRDSSTFNSTLSSLSR